MTRAGPFAMIVNNPFDLLRPYLWIAVMAFVAGFLIYAATGAGDLAHVSVRPPPVFEPSSAGNPPAVLRV